MSCLGAEPIWSQDIVCPLSRCRPFRCLCECRSAQLRVILFLSASITSRCSNHQVRSRPAPHSRTHPSSCSKTERSCHQEPTLCFQLPWCPLFRCLIYIPQILEVILSCDEISKSRSLKTLAYQVGVSKTLVKCMLSC